MTAVYRVTARDAAVLAERAAEHRRERLLQILAAATFLIFFQAYMVAPLIPRLAAVFGASERSVGLIVPAYLILYGASGLFYGILSDRLGRRKVVSAGCAAMMIWPFVYFAMLNTKSLPLVFIAILLALPIQDMQYGPQAAFISESFPGSRRYSGASLGYQLASITAGGPAPIVALQLYQTFKTSTAVAAYISLTALISLICVMLLKDRTGQLDAQ